MIKGTPMTPTEETGDLRVRVNALEHADAAIITRLNILEQWQRQTEIAEARSDEKWKNVDKRFDDLDKKIGAVSSILQRIMWIFITAIFLALAAFIIKGGLNLG
ncbi:hypothetical protein OSJ77_20080 [Phyllobacterium sp. 0TCS1.6C]|uniref:hypothetical protein n=1 Tax=unclassified Phyllobacterium TaxID=2638441 RepID=UPI002264148C|nr:MULTISPECIES: hypothetical protein [unclassified Phyllobacterium]MCX8282494.1 hypothetical protein [Phyllobacterium sp. 0TCS1.6C]MCX8292586.1 hypothetical protein [Phyllobacterium sp. 0TCS1.6A]